MGKHAAFLETTGEDVFQRGKESKAARGSQVTGTTKRGGLRLFHWGALVNYYRETCIGNTLGREGGEL